MQGKKQLQPKMLYTITLEQLVPADNFYRRLNKVLNLHWLYIATKKYYGQEGQESIDPVVFFKMCIVGYINNINSDRKLAEYCADRLGIRLFLGYDIDEPLPWHSTISRTRQLYGDEVFKQLFEQVFEKCIESGMIAGQQRRKLSVLRTKQHHPLYTIAGGALSGSEGFIYDEANDWYICRNNKLLKGSGRVVDDGRGHLVKKYFSLQSDCTNCPIRKSCITDKAKTKKIQHSIYKAELERAKARQQTVKAKVMKRKRSSTVEPVWGTLINFTV
jgi:transposase